MLAPTQTPTADATLHFRARAAERALPEGVENFLRMWGTEIWAAGAVQITLLRDDLPPDLRDSRIARLADGWILVAAPNGTLMTCYYRRNALRFIHRKATDHGTRKTRRRHRRR
jgi:hypothetical protein